MAVRRGAKLTRHPVADPIIGEGHRPIRPARDGRAFARGVGEGLVVGGALQIGDRGRLSTIILNH